MARSETCSTPFSVLCREVPAGIDELQAQALCELLPPWRRAYAERYRRPLDRWLCAEVWLLLQEGLHDRFGLTDTLEFVLSPAGKPSLARHPEIHFNLSHCAAACACIISANGEVGIDVECLQSFNEALARRVLNETELAAVRQDSDPDAAFTAWWTRKESVIKLRGSGLTDDLPQLLPAPGVILETEMHGRYVLSTARFK